MWGFKKKKKPIAEALDEMMAGKQEEPSKISQDLDNLVSEKKEEPKKQMSFTDYRSEQAKRAPTLGQYKSGEQEEQAPKAKPVDAMEREKKGWGKSARDVFTSQMLGMGEMLGTGLKAKSESAIRSSERGLKELEENKDLNKFQRGALSSQHKSSIFLNEKARKAEEAIENFFGGRRKVIEEYGEINPEYLNLRKENGKIDPKAFVTPAKGFHLVAQGMGSMLPSIGVAIATRDPKFLAVSMGAIEKGDAVNAYAESMAREKGIGVGELSDKDWDEVDEQSDYYAIVAGGLETIVPIRIANQLGGKPAVNALFKKAIFRVPVTTMRTVITEGGTEGLQRFSQNLIAKESGINPNQDLMEGVYEEAGAGAFGAGAFAFTGAVKEKNISLQPAQGGEPNKPTEPPTEPPQDPPEPPSDNVKKTMDALAKNDEKTLKEVLPKLSQEEIASIKKGLLQVERQGYSADAQSDRKMMEDILNEREIKTRETTKKVLDEGNVKKSIEELPIEDRKKVIETVKQIDKTTGGEVTKKAVEEIGQEQENQLELKKEKEKLLAERKANPEQKKEIQAKIDKIDEQRRDEFSTAEDVWDVVDKVDKKAEDKTAVSKPLQEGGLLAEAKKPVDKEVIKKYTDRLGANANDISGITNRATTEIKKIPSYEATVYKGISSGRPLRDLQIGQTLKASELESVSASQSVAKEFAERSKQIIEIKTPEARSISEFSHFPKEQENILFGGKYKITGFKNRGGYEIVQVEHIPKSQPTKTAVSGEEFPAEPVSKEQADINVETNAKQLGLSVEEYKLKYENPARDKAKEFLSKQSEATVEEIIKSSTGYASDGVSISTGGYYNIGTEEEYIGKKIPRGKIVVEIRGKKTELFSIKEIFNEIEYENKQKTTTEPEGLSGTHKVGGEKSGGAVEKPAEHREEKQREPRDGGGELGERSADRQQLTKQEIEDLVKSKSVFTDEEKLILAQYEGAGGQKGVKGKGLLDEYYTPESIVKKIWSLVMVNLPTDITNPKILEPSAGTGRFIKYAPDGNITAYETSPISSKIIKALYPNATVRNKPFEDIFRDEKGSKKGFNPNYDIVIGNPPYGIHRGKYKGLGEEPKIGRYEEYFIKRALDLTKEGGIVAMIVPSGFLRGKFSNAKASIANRGDLIEAFRLPNKSFKTTDIGTDIIIIKKHDYLSDVDVASGDVWANDTYFKENPERVLGKEGERKGRFGMEKVVTGELEDAVDKIVVDDISYKEEAEEQQEIKEAEIEEEQDLPEKGKKYAKPVNDKFYKLIQKDGKETFTETKGKSVKVDGFEDLDLFIARDSEDGTKGGWGITEAKTGMAVFGGSHRTQKEAIAEAKEVLTINEKRIKNAIKDNVDNTGISPRYTVKETPSKKTEKAKSVRREVSAKKKKTRKQKTPQNYKGLMHIEKDNPHIAVSDNKSDTKIFSQYEADDNEQYIFDNTMEDGSISDKAEIDKTKSNYYKGKEYNDFNYLQGDIYRKLEQLEIDKKEISDKRYKNQKAKLENTLPAPMNIRDITILPNDTIAREELSLNYEGSKLPLSEAFSRWIDDLPYEAFEGVNSYDIKGYIIGEVVNTGNKERNAKIRQRRREVGNKLFKRFYTQEISKEDQEYIVDSFNKEYNNYIRPDYTKYPLRTELNSKFYGKDLELRKIQMEGSAFLVNKGVGLLAYEVGVGKTLAGLSSIAEVMRKGWAKKPLIVVPKNLKSKWIEDIMHAVPNAKINDMSNLGGEFKYKGAMSDFKIEDGTISIITEEGFKRLGFSEETYERLTADLEDTTYSSKPKSDRQREIEKAQAEEVGGKAKRGTDFPITFEDLGFDHITFDEAHREKNVFSKAEIKGRKASEYRAIKGGVSERGLKAYLATQYILEKNNGRNVFLLTATPFTNSPIEIYSILSLMAKKRLEQMGIKNINQFISLFVEMESRFAIKASGKVEIADQVRKFHNLQQLQKLVREYIDFRTGEEAGIPRPKKIKKVPTLKLNKMQSDYMQRAQELFNDKSGGVLQAITELQKITLSPYLSRYHDGGIYSAKPSELVENSPKLKYVVEAIKKVHSQNPDVGQIIFAEKGIDVFDPLREYFIENLKYKPSEVAIIDSRTGNTAKDDIKDQFQNGEVKILLASGTVKEGVDLQENSTDLYNIFLPWNPTDMIQAEGRTWRQGSYYDNVRIHYPLLENSVDSFIFQKLEEKASRLANVWSYAGNDLDVSDIDFEGMKFELITDPVQRVEAKETFEKSKRDNAINVASAELAFSERKIKKLNDLKESVKGAHKMKMTAIKEKDNESVSYWSKEEVSSKKALIKEKASLKKKGIKAELIESQAKEKREEVKRLEEEDREMYEKFQEEIEKAKGKTAKTIIGETDFEKTLDFLEDKDFYSHGKYQKMTAREMALEMEYNPDKIMTVEGELPARAVPKGRISSEEAVKIFRQFFTEEEMPLEIVNRIIMEDGGDAFGLTLPDIVKFIQNPKESTPYHEAVHAYLSKFVNTRQWRAILKAVKKRKYGEKTEAEITNKELEEDLAEDFIKYVKTRKAPSSNVIKRFFNKVINFTKKLFGKENKIDAFYESIIERKRPGYLQEVKLLLDGLRDREVLYQEKERYRKSGELRTKEKIKAYQDAINKVFAEKRPPSLGKMVEEQFKDKERRTLLSAERMEAIGMQTFKTAFSEGKQVGYLKGATDAILKTEKQIEEVKGTLERSEYKNQEQRAMFETKLEDLVERHREQQSQLRVKIDRQLERHKRAKRKLREQLKQKLQSYKQIRKEIVEYIKDNLPRKSWGKFLISVRDAKTQNNLAKILTKVDKEVENLQRAEAVASIKKIMKTVDKIPVQYQMMVKNITDGIVWTGILPKTLKKLNSINTYIESHPEAKNSMPMRVLRRLDILDKKSYKDLTTSELMGLNAKLEMIKHIGEMVRIDIKVRKVIGRNQKLDILVSRSTNYDVIKHSGLTPEEKEKITAWSKMKNKLQSLDWQLLPIDMFLNKLDGGKDEGANYTLLKKPIDESYSQYLKTSIPIKQRLLEFSKEMKEKHGIEFEEKNYENIMLYATREQKGGRAKLLKNGYTEEQIDEMVLSEPELALYGWMRQELDVLFPMIKEVYEKTQNKILVGVENYFPFIYDWGNQSPLYQEMMEQYRYKDVKGGTERGFTIKRVGGFTPVKMNAMEVFNKHIDKATHFIAMEETVRDTRNLVKSHRYAQAVGEKAQSYMMRWLELMERHGTPEDRRDIEALNVLRKNLTLGILAYKMTTIPIQLGALGNGVAEIGMKATTGFNTIITSQEARDFVRNSSPEMSERVGDDPVYNEFLPSKKIMGLKVDREKIQKIGMWGIVKVDMMAAAGTWLGAYKLFLENRDIEFSYEEVNQEAVTYADRIVRKTQASALYKDLPPAMTGKYRTMGKMLLQFQTFLTYQFGYVRTEVIPNLSKDPKRAAWQATFIIVNALWATMMRDLIARGLWGDDDDYDEETLIAKLGWEMFQQLPIIGGLFYTAEQIHKQGFYATTKMGIGIPIADVALELKRSLALVYTSKKSETKHKYIVKTVEGVATLAGVPGATQASQFYRAALKRLQD